MIRIWHAATRHGFAALVLAGVVAVATVAPSAQAQPAARTATPQPGQVPIQDLNLRSGFTTTPTPASQVGQVTIVGTMTPFAPGTPDLAGGTPFPGSQA